MPRNTKLSTYVRNTGVKGRSASQSTPRGTFNSRTMIVIRMATTPSLNASRRPLLIGVLLRSEFYGEAPASSFGEADRTWTVLGHNHGPRRMQKEREPAPADAHDHGLGQTPEGRIRAALILTLLTMGASIAGGIF